MINSLLPLFQATAPASAPDPESQGFMILLIASEIGVTLIVFYGFYLVFNKFNKKMKQHKEENPEVVRQNQSSSLGNNSKE